ncbi:MAG TPA: efflux RND transporter periplasmic adaptor subunit [Thermodesulfovibrionales bacterium]|nr:efflux RND transporter periplasmic adaptor subunit [Thermodesulfovibrionales bacterium]
MVCKTRRMFRPAYGLATVVLFPALLLFAAGCGKKTQQQPPPPKVTVIRPVQRTITDYLELTGNTQAVNSAQLVARVAGYLDKVFFQDGQRVKKDQLLFMIQQDTYVAALQQSEGQVLAQKAQLEYAQSQLERYINLLSENAAAQTDVDNWRYQRDSAKANLKTAEASRDIAKLNLSYTEVAAPFDGRIDRRLQDPGNLVGSSAANTNLAQLIQLDPIYVYFTVGDADLAKLMKTARGTTGNAVALKSPVLVGLVGEEGYPHRGYIDFAATNVSTSTGTLQMRGVLPNPEGRIMPGLYARVHVPVETRVAMLVPATAVGSDQQGPYVLVVNAQNVVERRGVKPGSLQDNNLRVIEEGLTGNERIIVSALLKARPGSPVSPQLDNAATEGTR